MRSMLTVVLRTIHSAKGLEFVVFIADTARAPYERRRVLTIPRLGLLSGE